MLRNAAARFARNIENMSGGRMRIIVDASGRHKAPLGVFDMVRSGAYEMGHTASYYYKGKDPATIFFTTVPFGTPTEMNAWYYYGGGLELLNEVMRGTISLLSLLEIRTYRWVGGLGGRLSLEDLKGLKMRIPGHAGEVVGKVGMKPMSIPLGELYTALERGTIDAVVMGGTC